MRAHAPGSRLTYVRDRVSRDRDGRLGVVDLKTSRHEGAEVDAFLDRERSRYAAQLDAYAAALGGASRGLYFPLHSGWRGGCPATPIRITIPRSVHLRGDHKAHCPPSSLHARGAACPIVPGGPP